MTTGTRWAVLGLVVVVAVVAFVIAQSGGGSSSKSTTTAAGKPQVIVVKNAKPVGGVQNISAKKGGRVRFTVQSDVADEIHVHGYNYHKDVPKNGTISFDFPAKIDGNFVIELESRSEQIASLTVEP